MDIGQRVKVLNDNLKTQYDVKQGDVGDITNTVGDTHVEVKFNPDGGQPFIINMALSDIVDINYVPTKAFEVKVQPEVQN